MNEFLKIVGSNHICNDGEFNKKQESIWGELENKIKENLSPKAFDEISDLLGDTETELVEFSFVEGMKVAIVIMEKKYVPVL